MNSKRIISLIISISVLTAFCATGCKAVTKTTDTSLPLETSLVNDSYTESSSDVSDSTSESQTQSSDFVDNSVLVSFIGDCTLGEPLSWNGADNGFDAVVNNDFNYCFKNAADILSNDDMTLANFEGTLTDATSHLEKEFVFGSPSDYVQILNNGGVDAVNLANNHSGDYLDEGLLDTEQTMDEAGIVWSNEYNVGTYEVNGFLIGMAGMSFSSGFVGGFDAIDELKAMGCDIIIISCHWGYEREYEPRQEQIDLGHQLIDYGADIVIGTHPHRLQPIEKYNGKYIIYSLSNFVFGGNTYLTDPDTAIVQCEFIMNEDGNGCKAYNINVIPFSQTSSSGNDYCPMPYAWGSDEYYRVMSRLQWSQEDE